MISNITKDEYIDIWNRSALHILQHYFWGELKAYEGWEIERIKYGNEHVIQVQCKKVPYLPIRFGYIPKLDPAIFKSDDKRIEDELKAYFKDLGLAFVIIEFNKDIDESSFLNHLPLYEGHIQPQQSNIIDLSRSEDELWMEMEGNYRRNIKKGMKQGVKVSINEKEAIDDLYSIMEDIYENTKMLRRNKAYFVKLWELLGSINKAFVIKAVKDDRLLGSYLVVSDNKGSYELYGGVNKQGREMEAGYVLKWEAIKHAKLLGSSYYDHWGVAPIDIDGYDKKDELYRISLFKKGFGGKDVVFPYPRVLVCNERKYDLFKNLSKINKLSVRLRKLF